MSKQKNIIGLVLIMVAVFGISSTTHALTLSPVRVEISGDPGTTLSQDTTLTNEGTAPEVYYSSYSNFEAQGESGSPTFVDATDDLGTWMSTATSVSLAPGESKIVPVTITIPKDADAGGHFAAVFWGTTPPTKNASSVGIGEKTGILVLLTVNGNITEQGGILQFDTDNSQHFFTSLPVNFYYRFQNGGGDRIKPDGDITIKDMLSLVAAKVPGNPVEGNVLPASTRKFETAWQGGGGPTVVDPADQGNFFNKVGYEWNNFAFGRYTANIALAYGTKNEVSSASVSFWVFPWHLTIFVIVLLALIYFIGRKLIVRYNRWVIKMARESMQKETEVK